MARIDLKEFGGLLPAVQPRDLPDSAAQVALNVDTRHTDLRPTLAIGASLATVTAGAKSVFRTMSGAWLDSVTDADYVNNPVQDLEAQERVFLTGHAGYPEAWAAGSYRRLGVPRPTTKPATTLNAVFQFTAEDAEAFRTATIEAWKKAITDNLAEGFAGYNNAIAGPLPDGAYWLPHGTSTTPALPTTDARMGCYCVPVTAAGSTYKATDEARHGFAVNPALGGTVVTYSGSTYLAIPMYAQGTVLDFDDGGFSTDAAAIQNPEATGQLVAAPDIAWAAAEYDQWFARTEAPRKDLIADMDALVAEVRRVINPQTGDMLKQALIDFYASSAVAGTIDTAAQSLANTLYELAATVWAATELDVGGAPPSDILVMAARP